MRATIHAEGCWSSVPICLRLKGLRRDYARTHHRHGRHSCSIFDPRELNPERLGPIELEDVETGELLPLIIDDETIAHYRRNLAAWQRTIESICGRRGATYARVLSTWPLERQIIPYLRARQILT